MSLDKRDSPHTRVGFLILGIIIKRKLIEYHFHGIGRGMKQMQLPSYPLSKPYMYHIEAINGSSDSYDISTLDGQFIGRQIQELLG